MPNGLQLTKYWFALAYILLLVLGILSLMPVPDIGGSDKVAHFVVYCVLSAWFSLLVERPKSLWFILFGLTSYGLLLEYLQSLTSYRSGDLADAVANSLGVISGLAFYFSPLRRILREVDSWLLSRL
jgi:hypothetical protein